MVVPLPYFCNMKNITLSVSKERVYDEVAKSTSYVGAKMTSDDAAYSRIFTKDSDRLLLERFWAETCSAVTDQLKRFIVSVNSHVVSNVIDMENDYEVELKVSELFDEALIDSIETSLFNCFVASITSKWFKYTNREEVESYSLESAGYLDEILAKIYHRVRPTRPTINNEAI